MKTKQIFGYIGIGLFIIGFVILMDESLRNKAIGLFKSKPYVELTGSGPYQLNITQFEWGYGMTAINQFNGDFDKLDNKVFDLLKGKTGMCQVFLQATAKDKYGKADSTMNYIGDINIDELNRFRDWQYWQKDAGIRTLLSKQLAAEQSAAKVDSTMVATAITPSSTETVTAPSTAEVYSFEIDDLYPTEEKQKDFDQHHFKVDGTIGQVNFENGAMQVITNDGEMITVQFYPLDASSYVAQRLMIALKQGNKIKSVCARAGASTLDLLSAKITSS